MSQSYRRGTQVVLTCPGYLGHTGWIECRDDSTRYGWRVQLDTGKTLTFYEGEFVPCEDEQTDDRAIGGDCDTD